MLPLTRRSLRRTYGVAEEVEEVQIPFLPKATDARLISVDQKIERAEEELRKLRSEHNSLVPFSRLHPEVMSIIFRNCITHRPSYWYHPMFWLNATQVCRQWRLIALNSASTWSLIDFSHPSLTHEMILRSKAAPLDIEVTQHTLNPRTFIGLKEALSHIDRIRRLVLHASPSLSDTEAFLANLNKPAPLLQTFEIHGGSYVSFPDNLLGGEASRLRELRISGVHFPWSPSLFKDLTTLILNEPHDVPIVTSCSRCPSMKQLVEALQQMPGLETLELVNSLPLHTSEKLVPRCVVELLRLRRLRLSGTLLSCTEVLRSISFPPSAVVQITCKSFASTPDGRDAIPFLHRLSEIYSASSTSEGYFRTLCIDNSGVCPPFSIRANAQSGPYDPVRQLERLRDTEYFNPYDFQVDIYEVQKPASGLFRAAAQVFPLGKLEDLHLSLTTDHICSANDFVDLFGSLESLKTVTLSQRDIGSFLCGLRRCNCGIQENSPSELPSTSERTLKPCRLILPSLSTLKLARADFGEGSNVMNDVLKFFAFRKGHSNPVEKLVLRTCTQLYHHDVERISDAVAEVDWDRYEESEVSDEDEDESDEEYWGGGYDPYYYGGMYDDDDFDDGWDNPFEYELPW
ncbi:hypothetical protein L218DRAFT_991190 [Marasmius fiardii PR-910]|nr:hypothetical protein L218DRAFT_991190 [Marasmius fiardii PR-910]